MKGILSDSSLPVFQNATHDGGAIATFAVDAREAGVGTIAAIRGDLAVSADEGVIDVMESSSLHDKEIQTTMFFVKNQTRRLNASLYALFPTMRAITRLRSEEECISQTSPLREPLPPSFHSDAAAVTIVSAVMFFVVVSFFHREVIRPRTHTSGRPLTDTPAKRGVLG